VFAAQKNLAQQVVAVEQGSKTGLTPGIRFVVADYARREH
jgi:hypothetical protein